MKKLILIILSLGLLSFAFAQTIDDLIFEEEAPPSDLVRVNFQKKDARLAMLFSSILPGSGQFYASKSAFTAYLFPVIELGMIAGILYFSDQGNKRTEDFEYYANGEIITHTFNYQVYGVDYSYTYTGPRYQRSFQNQVQAILADVSALDVYDGSFFRLDENNSQHFYEDIGKYNKYIFGWADWYHTFAIDPTSTNATFILGDPAYADVWIFDDLTWIKNRTIEDLMNGITSNHISPSSDEASPFRTEYIQMRKDANQQYAYSRYFTFGLAFNHIASAIDAVLVTNRVNRTAITQSNFKLHYYTDLRNDRLTPSLGLSYRF
ncbi:MAG: hypothetical protein K0B87_01320 [Candidatus Syntrophosphaera sp.]|nr:hypothetical protein [Candidatus Syntrophosphaera sp.]